MVAIWDFHQDEVEQVAARLFGLRSNAFALAWSASNKYIFSGGMEFSVQKYDVPDMSPEYQCQVWHNELFQQQDSVRSISCHPANDELFMTASDDGRIIRYDLRDPSSFLHPPVTAAAGAHVHTSRSVRAQNVVQLESEATGVAYHPRMEHVFVTSAGSGEVCLRDARMAFGGARDRVEGGVVLEYTTKVRSEEYSMCNPEASSVVFDRDGSKLAVTFMHYLPTIYSLSDPNPLAICSGMNLPDGHTSPEERTYRNHCTMKHGSFGGAGLDTDQYYCAGSDDFRGYVWKVPPLHELEAQRWILSPDDFEYAYPCPPWETKIRHDGFATSSRSPVAVVSELATPLCRLTNHNSIVNSVLMHPERSVIASAGVERGIRIHVPRPAKRKRTDGYNEVRQLPWQITEEEKAVLRMMHEGVDPAEGDADADVNERNTILMFDNILREEGYVNLFEIREWSDGLDSDDDEEEDEDDEDMDSDEADAEDNTDDEMDEHEENESAQESEESEVEHYNSDIEEMKRIYQERKDSEAGSEGNDEGWEEDEENTDDGDDSVQEEDEKAS